MAGTEFAQSGTSYVCLIPLDSSANTGCHRPNQTRRAAPCSAATRARLTRDPRFGRLAPLRFATVMQAAAHALPQIPANP